MFSWPLFKLSSLLHASSPDQRTGSQGQTQTHSLRFELLWSDDSCEKTGASANSSPLTFVLSLGFWDFQGCFNKQPLGDRSCLEIHIIPWDVVGTLAKVTKTEVINTDSMCWQRHSLSSSGRLPKSSAGVWPWCSHFVHNLAVRYPCRFHFLPLLGNKTCGLEWKWVGVLERESWSPWSPSCTGSMSPCSHHFFMPKAS